MLLKCQLRQASEFLNIILSKTLFCAVSKHVNCKVK